MLEARGTLAIIRMSRMDSVGVIMYRLLRTLESNVSKDIYRPELSVGRVFRTVACLRGRLGFCEAGLGRGMLD